MKIRCPKCQTIQAGAKFCNNCGIRFRHSEPPPVPMMPQKKNNVRTVVLIVLGAAVVSGVLNLIKKDRTPSAPTAASVAQTPSPKEIALRDIKIKLNPSREGFGAVLVANVVVGNPTQYTVKDIVIECETLGASGTQIGTARQTIYQIFPAMKTTPANEVNFGFINSQVEGLRCGAKDLTVL